MQVIHWFTKNQARGNPVTMTLLDAIMAGVSDESNGQLRDFSGKCLCEFLRWSIKHAPAQQIKKNPFNQKSLFKRLYSIAKHPNPFKRLGDRKSTRLNSSH